MFFKLLALIVGLTGICLSLLVARQQRIDAANELSRIHQRLLSHEMTIWELRSRIVREIRPRDLEQFLDNLDEQWRPIPAAKKNVESTGIDLTTVAHHNAASANDDQSNSNPRKSSSTPLALAPAQFGPPPR